MNILLGFLVTKTISLCEIFFVSTSCMTNIQEIVYDSSVQIFNHVRVLFRQHLFRLLEILFRKVILPSLCEFFLGSLFIGIFFFIRKFFVDNIRNLIHHFLCIILHLVFIFVRLFLLAQNIIILLRVLFLIFQFFLLFFGNIRKFLLNQKSYIFLNGLFTLFFMFPKSMIFVS